MVAKTGTVAKTVSNGPTDEELLAAFNSGDMKAFGPVTDYAVVAPGMSIVKDDELVGVPFTILRANEHIGDYGPFISLVVIWHDKAGNKKIGVLNNGSLKSGVFAQMTDLHAAGIVPPIYVEKGLRKSEYTNEFGPAKTFYLAN